EPKLDYRAATRPIGVSSSSERARLPHVPSCGLRWQTTLTPRQMPSSPPRKSSSTKSWRNCDPTDLHLRRGFCSGDGFARLESGEVLAVRISAAKRADRIRAPLCRVADRLWLARELHQSASRF